ncbi:MAG: anti-sigma factor antagonist [Acidobacteriia bacterium]|nr:anti-sigma factor antagonist [Terriglobia bacterium]
MRLQMASRAVGDVLVIRCGGRIVAGEEVQALQHHVKGTLTEMREVVLHLEDVVFIDSSGLGALVRLLQHARVSGGELRLCNIPKPVQQTLKLTNILKLFPTYESEGDAIIAAYSGSQTQSAPAAETAIRVLCVEESADLRAYLAELLRSAGYRALTSSNVHDAKILLKAAKVRLIILGAGVSLVHGQSTREILARIDPSAQVLSLAGDFSQQDAGEAAQRLMEEVRAALK